MSSLSITYLCLLNNPLHNYVQGINNFMVLSWWGWWYVVYILYLRDVPPFPCGGYCYSLFSVSSVEERFETCPCIEIGRLSAPIPYFFIKRSFLRQKSDPFQHHNCIVNCIPYCSCKLPPIFELVDEVGEGLWEVVRPHNIDWVFLEANFQSPRRNWTHVVASVAPRLSQILSTGPSVETVILTAPLWRFDLLSPCIQWCSVGTELDFSKPFGSESLLLGSTHCQGVISGVVRWYEQVARPRHAFIRGHGEREVAIPASSKVQCSGFHIPNY